MKKRPNDIPHRRAFALVNGRKPKKGYHIHHIDGNSDNNEPANLVELSPIEHYQIHKEQEDWGACSLLGLVVDISPEELYNVQRQHGLNCVKNKTGFHSDESRAKRSEQSKQMWETSPPGRKPVTDGKKVIKFKTNEEVEEFLEEHPGWRKGVADYMKQGLKLSKRRISSEEAKTLTQKRITEGTHNFITSYVCPYCNKSGKGPMMKRWHFDNCRRKPL